MNAVATYLLEKWSGNGIVHSVFDHALNIACDEILLTVTADVNAGVPDSVVLSPGDWASVHQAEPGEAVEFTPGKMFFPGRHLTIELSCPNYSNTFPDGCFVSTFKSLPEEIHQHCLPEPAERLLPELIDAVNNGNSGRCEALLFSLIGLGQGLTPSADDALMGMMAIMACQKAAGIKVALPGFPEMVYRISEERTTDVSRKYMQCGAQGRFALPLIRVVSSLLSTDISFDIDAYNYLINTGHSSGRDTLRGIRLFLMN